MIALDYKKQSVEDYLPEPSTYYQVVPRSDIPVGRPLFDGKNESIVTAKLQWAFSIGATVKEACVLADISTDSFYRYCNKNTEFRSKIDLLQSKPILLARIAITKAIESGNVKLAMWYLERKRPQEFSPRVAESYMLREQERRIEYLENLLRKNDIDFSR